MTEVGPWRPEDDARIEAAYGQTMDELVAEAERGYCTEIRGKVDRERGGVHFYLCGKPAAYYVTWNPPAKSAPSLVCVEHMAEIRREIPELILTAQSLD